MIVVANDTQFVASHAEPGKVVQDLVVVRTMRRQRQEEAGTGRFVSMALVCPNFMISQKCDFLRGACERALNIQAYQRIVSLVDREGMQLRSFGRCLAIGQRNACIYAALHNMKDSAVVRVIVIKSW